MKEIARYRYVDEDGDLLYEVRRFDPKTFRQYQKDGTPGLNGSRRVPYRLPELITAIREGRPVWIVEGEKDVENLEAAGVTATCNSGGANGWDPRFGDLFCDTDVTIVADKDTTGQRWAEDVYDSLRGRGGTVRVVQAQHGKDASDHLAAGFTLDDFVDITNEVATAPRVEADFNWPPDPPPGATDDMIEPRPFDIIDLGDLLQHGAAEPAWVPGHVPWLYAGRLTAIQSEPGVGKTWLAIWLALNCITAGGAVLYMDEEGGPELIAERLRLLGATPEQIDGRLFYVPFPTRQWDLADHAALHQLLEQHPDIRLAVFDSLPDFLALAGKSEDSAQDVTWWIDRVCGICRDHDVAQVVLDHLVKPDPDAKRRSQSRYSRGSGAKLAKVDSTLLVETFQDFDAHTSGGLKLWKTKDRRGRLNLPNLASSPVLIDVTVANGSVELDVRDPEPDTPAAQRHHRPTRLMERLAEALERFNAAGVKPSQAKLEDSLKGNRAAKLEALRCLIDEGHVAIEGGPRNAVLHVLVKPYKEILDPRSDGFMVIRDDRTEEDEDT